MSSNRSVATLVLSSVTVIIAVMSCVHAAELSEEGIRLNNNPNRAFTPFVNAKVYGIRPVLSSDILSTTVNQKVSMKISREVFAKAAEQIPEINAIMKSQGLNSKTVSMSELEAIINKSGFEKKYLATQVTKAAVKRHSTSTFSVKNGIRIQNLDQDWTAKISDANAINPIGMTSILAGGMVDTANPLFVGNEGMYFGVRQEYFESLQKVVAGSEDLPRLQLQESMSRIRDLIRNARLYSEVERSLLVAIGDITFGMPIIYHSDELDMKLPRHISSNYDVFWLELGVSFREMNDYAITEMAFNLALPKGAVALKLVPLRYGVPTKVEETTRSPDVSVKTPQGEISIGEFFRRTVTVDYLRPVINSEGQGESAFGWKLYDEAIASGSHQFAAIVGLPKGEKKLAFAMSAHVQFKEYLVVSRIAGTDIHFFNTVVH